MLKSITILCGLFLVAVSVSMPSVAGAQAAQPAGNASPQSATAVTPPSDYLIGAEDVLGIVFWREPDLSGDVTVRPDGRITIPVIGEIQAAGKRPQQLQSDVSTAASKYITGVNVVVVVRAINSRKVFVTGRVTSPGTFPLTGSLTVMQAIALAGGLTEFADAKGITILRTEKGVSRTLKFNYQDIARGRSLDQNVQLQPGDTVVVP